MRNRGRRLWISHALSPVKVMRELVQWRDEDPPSRPIVTIRIIDAARQQRVTVLLLSDVKIKNRILIDNDGMDMMAAPLPSYIYTLIKPWNYAVSQSLPLLTIIIVIFIQVEIVYNRDMHEQKKRTRSVSIVWMKLWIVCVLTPLHPLNWIPLVNGSARPKARRSRG